MQEGRDKYHTNQPAHPAFTSVCVQRLKLMQKLIFVYSAEKKNYERVYYHFFVKTMSREKKWKDYQ